MGVWVGVSSPLFQIPQERLGLPMEGDVTVVSLEPAGLSQILKHDPWIGVEHPVFKKAFRQSPAEQAAQLLREGNLILRRALPLVRGWHFEPARARSLAEIGGLLMKVGWKKEATRLMNLARESAGKIDDSWHRAMSHGTVAVGLAEAGMASEARACLQKAQQASRRRGGWGLDYSFRSCVQRDFATMTAKVGVLLRDFSLLQDARESAGRIRNFWVRSQAQEEVAVKFAELGVALEDRALLRQAGKFTERIKDPDCRSQAQSKIAVILAQAEMIDEARAFLRKAEESAEQVLRHLSFSRSKVVVTMAKIGMILQDRGLLQQARDLAGRIRDPGTRHDGMNDFALQLAQAGVILKDQELLRRAQGLAVRVEGLIFDYHASVQCEVAVKMAKTGMLAEAETFLRQIWESVGRTVVNPSVLCEVQSKVVVKMAEVGMIAEARTFLQKIREFAEGIEDPLSHSAAQGKLAPQMAQAALVLKDRILLQQSQDLAKRIEDVEWRRQALGEVGLEMSKFGVFLLNESAAYLHPTQRTP